MGMWARWRQHRETKRAERNAAYKARVEARLAEFPEDDPFIVRGTLHPIAGIRQASCLSLAASSRRRFEEANLRRIIREEMETAGFGRENADRPSQGIEPIRKAE
jgi:hypothetical protein